MKPSFLDNDFWEIFSQEEKEFLLYKSSVVFKNGFSQKKSFDISLRIMELTKISNVLSYDICKLEQRWLDNKGRLNENEIINEYFFANIYKIIYNTIKNQHKEIINKEYDLRFIWSKMEWSKLDDDICFCCINSLNSDLTKKNKISIHTDCIDAFSGIAKSISNLVAELTYQNKDEKLPELNDIELNNQSIPLVNNESDSEETEDTQYTNKNFLDIF
jgi:hypothetical protein